MAAQGTTVRFVDGINTQMKPYSLAAVWGDLVFTSGQLPLRDGKVPTNFADQVHTSFDNLEDSLRLAGSSLTRVLKVTTYLADLDDFQIYDEIYAARMNGHRPSRTTVEVSRFRAGVRIEIEAVAVRTGTPRSELSSSE